MKWILLLLVSLCQLVRGQFLVPCEGQPTSYTGPPLPTLPQQFQAHIEANIVQKKRTLNFVEYFDKPGYRGAIVSYDRTSQEIVKTVMNFNEKEARVIYENKTCKYLKTNSTSNPRFAFMAGGNGTQLKSINELLYFGEDKGEVFIDGDKKVRGIDVNHWRTCVNMPQINGTFTLDYYFSKGSGYVIDGEEVQIPVRAVINGTGKSWHHNATVSDGYHSFYHIYEFFDFKPGIFHDPSVFEVPVGVICNQGDLPENKPTPELSYQFSAGVEKVRLVNGQERARLSMQLYIDMSAQILRLDVDRPIGGWAGHGSRPLIFITDYEHELQFVIDKLEKNCTVTKDVIIPSPRSHVGSTVPPPSVIMDFYRDFSNFTYQGQKLWRGIPVYSWGFYNRSSGGIFEILYQMPQSSGPGGPDLAVMDDLEPVGIYKTGGPGSTPQGEAATYEHMYGFSNGHPDPEIFDVSICYALDHHSTQLAVHVTGRDIGEVLQFHQKEFISEVRQTIAGAAKVSVTRIASIKWEEAKSSSTNTRLVVTFLLLDNKLSGMPDTVDTGPSLSQAISNLQASVNSGSALVFNIVLGTSHTARLSILEGTLYEVYSGPISQPEITTTKKYGSGSMAGLGIGMLIIGVLLGLGAAYIIYKRINVSVPYKVT